MLTMHDIGLIISISLLLAAGLAVYESPQVRQWVDESRRKIAIALHSLGDEIGPNRSQSEDASTREDESTEAAERRRRARQEILERGRVMEEKRRSRSGQSTRGKSFDDLVDEEGKLKKATEKEAKSTATETKPQDEGLRNRNTEAKGAAMGAAMADPFADEMHMDFESLHSPATVEADASTPPPKVEDNVPRSSPAVLQQEQQNLATNTDTVSNHPSELLVDLTPTTSQASSHNNDLAELTNEPPPQQLNYESVNEWAEHSSASFYTPPRSENADHDGHRNPATAASDAGTGEHVEAGDVDVVSELGDGISTPGSWTEVGSQISDED